MKLLAFPRSLATAFVLVAGVAMATASFASETSLVSEASNRYFVYFEEVGALNYQGEIAGLTRTANEPGQPFEADRPEVQSYRDFLRDQRSRRISGFEAALGRSLDVSYEFDVLHNAIVIEYLTASEAATIVASQGVRHVEIVRDYELATDRVSEFLSAGQVWDGTSTPSGLSYRGQGMVIGIIDTGLNAEHALHGAFSNDASCGFDEDNPKVIAAKDCIGSATCNGSSPQDSGHPHGSHVASTAAGNHHVAAGGALQGLEISGVAPCAHIISYKACPGQSCDGAALAAARQQAIIDQVDVINYSISGGNNPWSPGDANRDFLDMVNAGIYVAASAGNTNQTITNPIGNVNHRGPWVMTVANSTHDRISSNAVSLAGGPQDLYGLKGEMTIAADVTAEVADAVATGNALGCNPGFPAGSMTGRIALISRGDCTFAEKLTNAQNAGAVGGIIVNNAAGQPPIVMGGTVASIPAVMVSSADGLAIQSHLASNPTSQATISSTTVTANDPAVGDILSAGSLRGPIGGGIEVTAPDITGPGTNIFAAYNNTATNYGFMSGTSMSGPHVAGAGALVKGLHPDWTVMEVKSALQLTAKKEGLKDFTHGTPNSGQWDADDVGNGRVDLSKAALAGLVLNETYANFLAANANQAAQRALNLPSMRNTNCTPNCTWTRTVRNTLDTPSEWTASAVGLGPGLNVEVSPSSFTFTGDTSETQVLTITATPIGNQTAAVVFGEVTLEESAEQSPSLHMTVAIRGVEINPPEASVNPESFDFQVQEGESASSTLTISNLGDENLDFNFSADLSAVLWDQPQSGSNGIVSAYSTTQSGGAYTAGQFVLTAGADLTEIQVFGFDNSNTLAAQPEITWQIYNDVGGQPEGNPQTDSGSVVWDFSTTPGGAGVSIDGSGIITLDLTTAGESLSLVPGTYWLTVFPTYNNNITGAADPRWAWFQSSPVGVGSMLIAPNLFGNITSWTLTGAGGLGTAIDAVAFMLTGDVSCGASWLDVETSSGTVAGSGSLDISVDVDMSGLPLGTYEALLCIETNDQDQALITVPVSVRVAGDEVFHDRFEDATES
jgi:subtilisin family serine protease